MINSDNITIAPYVGKHAFDSLDTFVPHKSIVTLAEAVSQFECGYTEQKKRKKTSSHLRTQERIFSDISSNPRPRKQRYSSQRKTRIYNTLQA